jgi:hypothetical protein
MRFDQGMAFRRQDFSENIREILFPNVASDAIRNRCERLLGPTSLLAFIFLVHNCKGYLKKKPAGT